MKWTVKKETWVEYFLKMDVFVYVFFVLISEATRLLFSYGFDDVLLRVLCVATYYWKVVWDHKFILYWSNT